MSETDQRASVSVALCTHNGERFIAEQLRSILHQSVTPEQVVVSDDASSDSTLQIVKDVFARFRAEKNCSAPVLTVLENMEPLGVTANFEQAITACTGDLISLSDQDDLWVANRLERMVAEFGAHPELTLLHSDARLVDDKGHPLAGGLSQAIEFSEGERELIHAGEALNVLLRRNVVTGATTMFRRSLLDSAVPFPKAWVHDEWLAIVAAIVGRVDFLPEALIDYRQHGTNEIGAAKPTMAIRFGRLKEPRRDRNRRLLARAEALMAHVTKCSDSLPKSTIVLASGKVAHERFRSALPASRVLRLIPILRMAASGSYRTFGLGRQDMLRDLVQPDR